MATKKKPAKSPQKPRRVKQTRLTHQQERFVEVYVETLNRITAYKAAGFIGEGQQAHTGAHKLMRTPLVCEAIADALECRKQRAEVSQDYTLRRLQREIEYHGDDGSQRDRIRGIELLMKHLRMLPDSIEVTGRNGNPIEHDHQHEHIHTSIRVPVEKIPAPVCRQLLELKQQGDQEGIKRILLNYLPGAGNESQKDGKQG